MKQFKVTTYSPEDEQETENTCQSVEDLDKVCWTLVAAMEVGAWFKIERTD